MHTLKLTKIGNSIGLFFGLNGYKLKATQVDATLTMLAVAAGEVDEQSFAGWIRKNAVQRSYAIASSYG